MKATYPACVTDERMAVPLIQAGTIDSLREPWALYRIGLYPAFPTQAFARTAVRYERRLELAMEGQHFFDLRRWGSADTVLANYIAVEQARIPYFAGVVYATRNHLYPIPALQIELSKVGGQSMLVQNPGW